MRRTKKSEGKRDILPRLRMPRSKGGRIALWTGVALGGLWLLGKMGGA